ncbi:hypothetical protein BH11MYX1_BH11MYX1_14390 [soil metagenome]
MSIRISKFLSLVLRHEPARFGIALDSAGWTSVDALLAACAEHGVPFTRDELVAVVATSDKQRFALSPEGDRIRANQGHSVEVELELTSAVPPAVLYHGTVDRFLEGIRAHGLVKGQRHHVHMSADLETAKKFGGRRGKPVILTVRAAEMVAAGLAFLISQNGVWLIDHVPPAYVGFPDQVKPNPHASGGGSRGAKVKIAKQTLEACDAGYYTNAAGTRVELAAAIEAATTGTELFELDAELSPQPAMAATVITVTGESTIEAMIRLTRAVSLPARPAAHLACLNFASARNPGGGFLGGAQAQEESLARSSALYPCQLTHTNHYERNRIQKSLLYLDLALWSPHVPFFRDDEGGWLATPLLASVITCAAPNAGALGRGTSSEELETVLTRRARLVLALARHHGVETLVLGAWGAGVFKNDPVMVARIFKALLAGEFANVFARVVFAVIGNSQISANHRAFAEAFA